MKKTFFVLICLSAQFLFAQPDSLFINFDPPKNETTEIKPQWKQKNKEVLVMGKIKIDKHDHLRVILTETLPYEVPINFLNEGVYHYLKSQELSSSKVSKPIADFIDKFFNYDGYTKPYNYRILTKVIFYY